MWAQCGLQAELKNGTATDSNGSLFRRCSKTLTEWFTRLVPFMIGDGEAVMDLTLAKTAGGRSAASC